MLLRPSSAYRPSRSEPPRLRRQYQRRAWGLDVIPSAKTRWLSVVTLSPGRISTYAVGPSTGTMRMNLTHSTTPAMIVRTSRTPMMRAALIRARRGDPPVVGLTTSGVFCVPSSMSVTFASHRWLAVQIPLQDVDRLPLILGGTPGGTRQPLARSCPSDSDRRQALVHQFDAHSPVETPFG